MVIKNIINNFWNMPVWMRFLPMLGLLTPLLAISTVMTNEVVKNNSNYFVLIITVISTIPTIVASITMLLKFKISRLVYLLGWYLVYFTPLISGTDEIQVGVFLIELSFNLLIGIALAVYLFRNKQVNNYFYN